MKTAKKFICSILSVMMVMAMGVFLGETKVYAEEDTSGYIEISTVDELYGIRNNPSGKYILTADIDLTEASKEGGDYDQGFGWTPIEEFSGVLDGNGHRINGMHIYGKPTERYLGLIGVLRGGTVRNLGMTNISIDVVDGEMYGYSIGGVVGDGWSNSTIKQCYTTGVIKNENGYYSAGMGGIAGEISSTAVDDCYNQCELYYYGDESYKVGGIVGYVSKDTIIKNCYNMGMVTNLKSADYGNGIMGIIDPSYVHQLYYTLSSCYYLKSTALNGYKGTDKAGMCMKLTDAQMKKATSFGGFDFKEVWEIDPYCGYDYPQLKNNRIVRVNSLELVSEPQKLSYYVGDTMNLVGSKLKVTYENGNEETIVITPDMISGYDMSAVGTQRVMVSLGGKECSFEIEVLPVEPTKVSINKKECALNKNASVTLSATVLPANATDTTVTWSSEDESIAVIDAKGVVKGKSAGTTTIVATTANGLTAKCKVIVKVPCKVIVLEAEWLTLTTGQTETLDAVLSPFDTTDEITWKSSNKNVVTCDGGKLTAVGSGQAKITARSSSGVSAECTVTVNAKSQSIQVSSKASKTVSYKASVLKKNKASFNIAAKAKTAVSYKVTKGSSKYISVSSNGKVTLKKGCKKGTYKITVTAKATSKYKKATKIVTITVK